VVRANYKGPETSFNPDYCPMLIEHMSKGFSYESFAAKIGTCRDTLYNWEKLHPEWSDTKKQARELCQYWWESAGINGMYTVVEHGEDGSKNIIEKKINQAMWIFNMKARFRWDDEPNKVTNQLPEREVLTLEDKKKLLEKAKKEIEKLEEEVKGINE
jgi:hypothetical protein